jgi:polyisoprenoid-binding protein YceI
LVLSAVCVVAAVGCEEKKTDAAPTTSATALSAPPSASAAASGSASAGSFTQAAPAKDAIPAGSTRFAVAMGKGTFLIDAPLEKIKGGSDEVKGHVDVNPKELAKTKGEINVRLSVLKTNTFGDMDRDSAQTEHARNWMEVGMESSASNRMKYEWATFTITSFEATPATLADAKEEGGARKIKAKVGGDLVIHGVTSKKTANVTLTFKGPADAPTELQIKTDEPMPVSLKEHDVKPRDTVGGVLNGALDRIGKKIDDKVQVSFDATTKATMPAHP